MESVNKKVDLSVNLGPLALANPIMTASGTFGYGREFSNLTELNQLGAIVVKGISLKPRAGNPPPRIVETACGMLNAIGLENVGVEKFVKSKMVFLSKLDCPIIVNILGDSLEEYGELAARLSTVAGIAAIEVNISCPNVKKGGVAFGTNAAMAEEVTKMVKRSTHLPVIVKLSPNVTDIVEMAKGVENGGGDIVSLINTLIGMAIDPKTRRPKLANIIGGLSGPAIKPVALRMVYQVAQAVNLPVVGIGGISSAEDAVEFLLAGASAVQIGTANFFQPDITTKIIEGIKEYLQEQGESEVSSIIGSVKVDS